jgi:hypothetical protein
MLGAPSFAVSSQRVGYSHSEPHFCWLRLEFRMLGRNPAKIITISGLCLVVLGTLMAYILELVSYNSTDTRVFRFLEVAFLPTLLIGIVTLFVGSIRLVRQVSSQTSFAIGILCFLAWMVGTLLEWVGIVRINAHDWSAILLVLTLFLIPFGLYSLSEDLEKGTSKLSPTPSHSPIFAPDAAPASPLQTASDPPPAP